MPQSLTSLQMEYIRRYFPEGDGNYSPHMSMKSCESPMELPIECEFQSTGN